MLGACTNGSVINDNSSYETHTVEHPRKTGDIADFNLVGPENGFVTTGGFTFTWEACNNADYYALEIASTSGFITDDSDEVYVKESNLFYNHYDLSLNLPKKDAMYYWKVSAINADHKKTSEIGNFFCASPKIDEIPIKI